MWYAFSFLQYSTFSPADLAIFGDLLLAGFAIAAILFLLRAIWRLLRSVLHSMAGLLSWAIAVGTLAFLFFRLVRFFG
jgi:hypothetical protein